MGGATMVSMFASMMVFFSAQSFAMTGEEFASHASWRRGHGEERAAEPAELGSLSKRAYAEMSSQLKAFTAQFAALGNAPDATQIKAVAAQMDEVFWQGERLKGFMVSWNESDGEPTRNEALLTATDHARWVVADTLDRFHQLLDGEVAAGSDEMKTQFFAIQDNIAQLESLEGTLSELESVAAR